MVALRRRQLNSFLGIRSVTFPSLNPQSSYEDEDNSSQILHTFLKVREVISMGLRWNMFSISARNLICLLAVSIDPYFM